MSATSNRRGFACEDRDNTKTPQTANALSKPTQSSEPLTSLRNRLHMRGLRKQRPYVLLLLLFALHLNAAKDIVVRTNINPESVWVGQRMTLQIDVLGKDGWAQITDTDRIDIPNCYRLPSGNSRVRLQETIDGNDYSGQRYELSLYPQRSGSIEIPELSLPIKVQTWGAGTTEQIVNSTARSIEAKLPAGVQNVQSFVASDQFSVSQTWSSESEAFKVGDALKRTITLKANNLPSMMLPTLSYPDMAALSSYPESPALNDNSKSSPPVGTRIESITYVFEANGTAELPTYSFQWWNPNDETLQTLSLPGRKVILSGGVTPAQIGQTHTTQSNRTLWLIAPLTMGFLLAAGILIRFKQLKRPNTALSEKKQFAALLKQSASKPSFLLDCIVWVETLTTHRLTLSEFLNTFADTNTQHTAAILLRNPTHSIDLPKLKRGLRAARGAYLKAQIRQQHQHSAERMLPRLND